MVRAQPGHDNSISDLTNQVPCPMSPMPNSREGIVQLTSGAPTGRVDKLAEGGPAMKKGVT